MRDAGSQGVVWGLVVGGWWGWLASRPFSPFESLRANGCARPYDGVWGIGNRPYDGVWGVGQSCVCGVGDAPLPRPSGFLPSQE